MSDEKATVIIVTEARNERDRRYDANQAEITGDGHLRLLRKGREIGAYQLDGWLSWREEGALVPDGGGLDDGYPDSEREADALAYQRNGDDERDDQ